MELKNRRVSTDHVSRFTFSHLTSFEFCPLTSALCLGRPRDPGPQWFELKKNIERH